MWTGAIRCIKRAMQCRALPCYGSAVQCNAVPCSALRYSALHRNTVQYGAVQCLAVQCSAIRCSAVPCSAVRCSAGGSHRGKCPICNMQELPLPHPCVWVGVPPTANVLLQCWGWKGIVVMGGEVQFSEVQCGAVGCSSGTCCWVQCSVVLYIGRHPVHNM